MGLFSHYRYNDKFVQYSTTKWKNRRWGAWNSNPKMFLSTEVKLQMSRFVRARKVDSN